jgi:hypothetical protein
MKKIFKIFFVCALIAPTVINAQITYNSATNINTIVDQTGQTITITPLGDVTVQSGGHLIANNFDFQGGSGILTVQSGGRLTVLVGVLDNVNATITIQHGGSLITNAATTFATGNIIIQKTAASVGYSFITMPISSGLYDGTESIFDESDHSGGFGSWNIASNGDPKEIGIGYAVYKKGTVAFTGTPNVGPIDLSLSLTSNATRGTDFGHHLIGNPYSAEIDMDDFFSFDTNNNSVSTYGNYYIWNPNNNDNAGGYETLTNGFVSSGQAFFIQLNAALGDGVAHQIKFDDSMIAGLDNTPFFRKAADEYGEVVINFSTSKDLNNKLAFRLRNDFTTSFDKRYDAYSSPFEEEGQLRVKSIYNEREFDLIALPLGNASVPVLLNLKEALTVNAEVVKMDGIPDGYTFQLVDLTTGTSYPLSASSKLSFDLPATANLNTFEVRVLSPVLGTKPETQSFIYSKNQQLIFKNNNNDNPSKLFLYTLDGRIMGNWNIPSDVSEYTMPLSGSFNGLYLVKVQTVDGFYTQKVIIK